MIPLSHINYDLFNFSLTTKVLGLVSIATKGDKILTVFFAKKTVFMCTIKVVRGIHVIG